MSNRDGWDEEPEYDIDPDIEEYERYDDDEGAGGRRRSLMLLSVIALLVVFAGVVFLAYRQGSKGPDGAPPILRADDQPTKELPENPGGKKFPHQDAGVYNRITGEGRPDPSEGEQLLPPAEEPLAIDNAAIPTEQDQQALDRMAQSLETNGIESAPLEQVPSSSQTGEQPEPVQEAPAVPEAPAPAPVEETPSPAAAATPASSGDYVVQLAAFRDEPAARDAFKNLQSKYPELLGSRSVDIQRADLGEKGIYYRLRAGYMDKAAADGLCASLEARGQGCLVRQK